MFIAEPFERLMLFHKSIVRCRGDEGPRYPRFNATGDIYKVCKNTAGSHPKHLEKYCKSPSPVEYVHHYNAPPRQSNRHELRSEHVIYKNDQK
jgi:hypothetical protein